MDFKILLLIFVLLVFADKALTMMNLTVLSKDKPANYLDAEQNIAAKWFFQKCGLLWGSILFGIVTLCTLFIMFYCFKSVFGVDKTLWFIFLVYGAVIFNNIFYLLKNLGWV